MKKAIILSLAISFVTVNYMNAQSGLLNKASNAVSKEVLGKTETSDNAKPEPEPSCASDQAIKAMDLGGKLEIDYREISISILSDGRILAQAHGTDEYYVAKDGITTGPFKAGDPKIADFVPKEIDDKTEAGFLAKYKPYITKSGDKYLITFAGKKYGPYARIDNFTVSRSKDKFAALATENVIVTEDQGKKMEEAMANAKTDDERMELAMEYAQQMSEVMTQEGGMESTQAKLVTNIPNAKYDLMKAGGGTLNGNLKYDDIPVWAYDKIIDLQMNVILNIKPEAVGASDFFVNTNNTLYAYYKSGTLTFSNNKTMTDLFNPYLVKKDGRSFRPICYYSPKNNAVMQHKIPF